MRRCFALPLVFALSMGCRPGSDASTPATGEADALQSSVEDQPTPVPRPAGAVFRSELVRATRDGNPAYLLSQLAPEPYRPSGRFEGWTITRIWPGDPDLCAPGCDLEIGDVIMSVNGSTLETPEALSTLLERLPELEVIEVRGLRGGEYFERSFPVLPDP